MFSRETTIKIIFYGNIKFFYLKYTGKKINPLKSVKLQIRLSMCNANIQKVPAFLDRCQYIQFKSKLISRRLAAGAKAQQQKAPTLNIPVTPHLRIIRLWYIVFGGSESFNLNPNSTSARARRCNRFSRAVGGSSICCCAFFVWLSILLWHF